MTCFALSFAQSEPAQAYGLYPSPYFDANEIGWFSNRDMSSQTYSNLFFSRADAGYMVADIDIYERNGAYQVAAVWQRNVDGREWIGRRNLTSSQFSTEWTQNSNAGYRLIDQEAYVINGELLYAALWVDNLEDYGWASRRNLTSTQFGDEFWNYRNAGYILVDVESYLYNDTQYYSAIWLENVDNLDWLQTRNMTAESYADYFQQRQEYYRVADLEVYETANGLRYAAIWIENRNRRGWAAFRDMTSQSFNNKWEELRDLGYRIIDQEAYLSGETMLYAGVWRQDGDRLNWPLRTTIDQAILDLQSRQGYMGISVAIMQNGEFVYHRGFGFRDQANNRTANANTIYRLASVSKAVGGALALDLDERGFIEVADFASDFATGLPNDHTYTISQTAMNRSGIGHYSDYNWTGDNGNTNFTSAQAAVNNLISNATTTSPSAFSSTLHFDPSNSTYRYSTHAYTFLGAALEGATSQTIDNLIVTHLTNRYNLPTLRPEIRSNPNSYRSELYSGGVLTTPDDLSWKRLGGGLESSVIDLARFGNLLINGQILSNGNLNNFLWSNTPGQWRDLGYGHGFEAWETACGRFFAEKAGDQRGSDSVLVVYPDDDVVVAVMTNQRQNTGRNLNTFVVDEAAELGRWIGNRIFNDCGSSVPGDCNADGLVNAGDLSAYDIKFNFSTYFPAAGGIDFNARGCDSNNTGLIAPYDETCARRWIFDPSASC